MTSIRKEKLILIIEDNTDIRNFVSRLLELEGYRVLNTGDSEEGMSLLRGNHVDLLLLDLLLPGRDGWSILKEMKSTPELADIPVVALTAVAESPQRRRTLQMGAADYLIKPLSVGILKKTVRNILAQRPPPHSPKSPT